MLGKAYVNLELSLVLSIGNNLIYRIGIKYIINMEFTLH